MSQDGMQEFNKAWDNVNGFYHRLFNKKWMAMKWFGLGRDSMADRIIELEAALLSAETSISGFAEFFEARREINERTKKETEIL